MSAADSSASASTHAKLAPMVEASIERHGDKSYFYWQGKVSNTVPIEAPRLIAKTAKPIDDASSTELISPIDKFLWSDDGALVKVFVELDGVGALPADRISCAFHELKFELKVRLDDHSVRRLAVPELKHPIDAAASSVLVKPNKLILKLAKLDKEKFWFELLAKK